MPDVPFTPVVLPAVHLVVARVVLLNLGGVPRAPLLGGGVAGHRRLHLVAQHHELALEGVVERHLSKPNFLWIAQHNVGRKNRNSVSSPSKIMDVVFENKAPRSTYVPKSFPLWPVYPVCGPLEGRLTPVYCHIWYGTSPHIIYPSVSALTNFLSSLSISSPVFSFSSPWIAILARFQRI